MLIWRALNSRRYHRFSDLWDFKVHSRRCSPHESLLQDNTRRDTEQRPVGHPCALLGRLDIRDQHAALYLASNKRFNGSTPLLFVPLDWPARGDQWERLHMVTKAYLGGS